VASASATANAGSALEVNVGADIEKALVDVPEVVDRARFGPYALMVSALTTLALVFDGFDIQAIAFAAPKLMSDWAIDRSQLAPILAAGLLGMFVGALVLGVVGDRYGRRRALLGSMALMAGASLLAATADGPGPLATYRFLTGLGLGGALPNAAALMVEFAPLAVRTVVVAITVVGVPIGGMFGAAVAARLVPAYDWPSIFVLGGVLPGVLLLVMAWLLPESPQYLARHPARATELADILNRVLGERRYDGSERFRNRDVSAGADRAGPLALFNAEHRRETLVIWLIFFTNVFTVYCFFSWTPTVLTGAGLSLATALRGLLLFNLGGVVGSLLGAWWMGRVGSRPVLLAFAGGAALATLALGWVEATPEDNLALMACLLIAGACISGLQVQMYTVAASAYPTELRATGVGWALGTARLGGVLSAFAGSVVQTLGSGLKPFFTGIALVIVATFTGIALLKRHLPPRR
jgi:AAHS family 4-hydroxybenzoate transporter-like MFS transporter